MTHVNGNLPESVAGSGLAVGREFDAYYELTAKTFSANDNIVYGYRVTIDKIGRIVSRTETAPDADRHWEYADARMPGAATNPEKHIFSPPIRSAPSELSPTGPET